MGQVAFADFRDLTFEEVDAVNGGVSTEDVMLGLGLGIAANLLTPLVVAAAVPIALGVAINMLVATPAN